MPQFQSYVICTSPRSGSTLLCRMLRDSGVAGAPDSHFHTPSLARWAEVYGVELAECGTHMQVLAQVMQRAMRIGRGESEIFGLRLQRGSFDYLRGQFEALHPELKTDVDRFEAVFGRTLFVHLTREDKLAQAVSYLIAEQSGLWHRAQDGSELERLAPPKVPQYDHALIAAKIAELDGFDRAWEAWFKQEGIAPLRVAYGALAADPKGQLKRVLLALGVDGGAAQNVQIGVAKLADEMNQAWIDRFRADTAGMAN